MKFGEKLYRYYSYVVNNPKLTNVKYIVKMDDDALPCPKKLFEYLDGRNLTGKSYAGWFHNMDTWKSQIDRFHRADEMFLLLGRDLVTRIASKPYCNHPSKIVCDSLGQLSDANCGGEAIGVWLSQMQDVNPLPMNNVIDHKGKGRNKLRPEDTLLFHTAKTPEIAKQKYANCQKMRLK